jgi:hypothetical protein
MALKKKFLIKKEGKDFLVKVPYYTVVQHTKNYSHEIYSGYNYDYAKYKFEDFGYKDLDDDEKLRDDNYVVFSHYENHIYKYRNEIDYDDDEALEEIKDYLYSDRIDYNLENYFDFIDSEYVEEEIDSKNLEYINKKSDDLLNEVQEYFYKNADFSKNFGKYNYFYETNIEALKNTLSADELDELEKDYIGTVVLRVSDHTENLNNWKRYDISVYGDYVYYISVIIADLDLTKNRSWSTALERDYNEFGLYFNSNDDFEDIINEIWDLIHDCLNEIKRKYLNEYEQKV